MRAVKCSSRPWSALADLFSPVSPGSARAPTHPPAGLAQTYRVGAPSVFVTGTAWFFIVLAALVSVAALLHSAETASLLPGLQLAGDAPLSPQVVAALRGQLPWVLGGALVLSLATLASAIGLLLRLEGARRVFVGLLVLAIVFHLGGLALQQVLVHAVVVRGWVEALLPAALVQAVGGPAMAARCLGALLSLGACVALVGVIRGLSSRAVRQEFA